MIAVVQMGGGRVGGPANMLAGKLLMLPLKVLYKFILWEVYFFT